jgi:hypothetical protein
MSARDQRLAKNEDHVRDINESIEETVERGPIVRSSPVAFVCECSDPGCAKVVELTLGEYRHVRTSPLRFVVFPGHELLSVERVVERTPGYVIVEKVGEAAEVARETA